MKHFFVVAREDKKEILEFVQKLTDYIEKKGGTCSYGINPDDALEAELDVPEDTQGILVAGGDPGCTEYFWKKYPNDRDQPRASGLSV